MKRLITVLMIVLIVALIVLAGCAMKEVDKPNADKKPITADQEDVDGVSAEISAIPTIDNDLDMSDLDNLDSELKDIEDLI